MLLAAVATNKVFLPTAVLPAVVVFALRELDPIAIFVVPVVLASKA